MKKDIVMETINPKTKAAQSIVCTVAFYALTALAAAFILVGIMLPIMVNASMFIHWIGMLLEACAAALGFCAYWVCKNAME
jgi:uncharacterized membrane protein YdjX (TVP38/TMEM64 family)